jgi:RNA polymerase sigma-70 factor (ECF subfamily)
VPLSWTGGGHVRSIDSFGEDPDDATLLAAVVDGRHARVAMALLYDRHADAVRKVCNNQLRTDRDNIEDLVQDVFVLLQRHAGGISDPALLRRWLRTTARNACVNHRARAHNQREVAVADAPDGRQDVADFTDELGHADQVARLLTLLPTKSAQLLDAFYLRGMTLAEIADWLGSTQGSIKTQIHRIRGEARRLVEAGKAMIPLPVIEWWGRTGEVLRIGGGAPAAAVLVPVLAVGLLVLPGLEGHSPATQRPTLTFDIAGVTPAIGLRADASSTPSATDDMGPRRPGPAVPSGAAEPEQDRSADDGYAPPPPSPIHTVDVPGVGPVQTYEQPTEPPQTKIAVAPEQTGELAGVEAYDPTVAGALDTVCAPTSDVDAIACGP